MMRSLFSGVSGLKSHQTKMDVIGNNISNINTVGFKSSRATFADMLSQTTAGAAAPSTNLGGTNPKQIGLGVAVASIDLIFTDGSPQATGKNTDLALSGNGLFVIKSGSNTYYTRDGAFEFDGEGNYVLPGSGYLVQGWNAVDGALNTNAQPTNIVVPAGKTMPASASTQVDFSGNLNASSLTITGITFTSGGATADPAKVVNYDADGNISGVNVDGVNVIAATLTMSDGSSQKVTTGFYQVGDSMPLTTVVTIYDSEGKAHAVTLLLDKDATNYDPNMNEDARGLTNLRYANGDPLENGEYTNVTFGEYNTETKSFSAVTYDTETNGIATSHTLTYDSATGTYTDGVQTGITVSWDNRWRTYISPTEGNQGPAIGYQTRESDGSLTD